MKILLEQNFKSEFDLSNEEYVFGHEDGQQEIISPYRLLVDFNNQKKHALSDLFYNNLEIPKFWSIYPQELDGEIMYHGEKKADIYFKSPNIMRNVHGVAWLDGKFNYKTDYYDLYGLKFFSEYFDKSGRLMLTTFYTDDNKEILSVHHKNEVFIINSPKVKKVFFSYKDFVEFIINECRE